MLLNEIREKFTVAYHIVVTSTLCDLKSDAEGVVNTIQDLTGEFLVALEVIENLEGLNIENAGSVDAFLELTGHEPQDREDLQEIIEGFEDSFVGDMSVEDYAREYIDDTGVLEALGETLRVYFDYEMFARDLLIGGDVSVQDGWLFRSNW